MFVYSFRRGVDLKQDVADNCLSLGKLYWKMDGKWRTDKEKCLQCLLKVCLILKIYTVTDIFYYHSAIIITMKSVVLYLLNKFIPDKVSFNVLLYAIWRFSFSFMQSPF